MIQLNTDPKVIDQIIDNYLCRVDNLPLPQTFMKLERFTTRPKYIIIHDTNCLNHSDSLLTTDGPKTGMGALKINDIAKAGYKDINYHYIVDRLSNDYEIISGRPMHSKCEPGNDIDKSISDLSIHVIILSDLNVDIPKNRLYQVLADRCLAPLIRMLKMGSDPSSVIKFHDEIKLPNSELKCPGEFLARELLVAQTRRFM